MNEKRKAYKKAYYQAHKAQINAASKAWKESHKDECKAKNKAYNQLHKDQRKAYTKREVNSLGQTKKNIRKKSWLILKRMNMHINDYEIHHCFGYEDAFKFIYINKSLHLKIHQFLRDNNIDAGTNHWMAIRDIVNNTEEFTYIKC